MPKPKNPANNYIPTDYEDLYRYYIEGDDSLATAIIRKKMPYATYDEIETLRHDVFVRLLDKGMLERFDPTKSNFGGVIYFTARSVIGNHLDRKGRNPLTGLHAGVLEDQNSREDFEPGTYSLDRMFATQPPDHEGQLEARELVQRLVNWATEREEEGRNKRDRSLKKLIYLMAEECNTKECAEELGVTVSTIFNWVQVIRQKALELRAA